LLADYAAPNSAPAIYGHLVTGLFGQWQSADMVRCS